MVRDAGVGWGEAKAIPGAWGCISGFPYHRDFQKKKMQLSLGCTDFEKLGGPLDRDLWKELDIEDECVSVKIRTHDPYEMGGGGVEGD